MLAAIQADTWLATTMHLELPLTVIHIRDKTTFRTGACTQSAESAGSMVKEQADEIWEQGPRLWAQGCMQKAPRCRRAGLTSAAKWLAWWGKLECQHCYQHIHGLLQCKSYRRACQQRGALGQQAEHCSVWLILPQRSPAARCLQTAGTPCVEHFLSKTPLLHWEVLSRYFCWPRALLRRGRSLGGCSLVLLRTYPCTKTGPEIVAELNLRTCLSG